MTREVTRASGAQYEVRRSPGAGDIYVLRWYSSYVCTGTSKWCGQWRTTKVDSDEVRPDLVIDTDADGNVVGIEIEHASSRVDLENVSFATLPFQRGRSA
jgi:uncharacterized protein YuzE